jgi:hypothetical protein
MLYAQLFAEVLAWDELMFGDARCFNILYHYHMRFSEHMLHCVIPGREVDVTASRVRAILMVQACGTSRRMQQPPSMNRLHVDFEHTLFRTLTIKGDLLRS